jgi:hypothetical protein
LHCKHCSVNNITSRTDATCTASIAP